MRSPVRLNLRRFGVQLLEDRRTQRPCPVPLASDEFSCSNGDRPHTTRSVLCRAPRLACCPLKLSCETCASTTLTSNYQTGARNANICVTNWSVARAKSALGANIHRTNRILASRRHGGKLASFAHSTLCQLNALPTQAAARDWADPSATFGGLPAAAALISSA